MQLTPDPGNNLEDLSTDDAFDQLRAARILAGMVVEPLFDAARSARMVGASLPRQPDTLTFPELVDTVLAHSWSAGPDATPSARALRRVTQQVALESMMMLGGSDEAAPEARAYVLDKLATLATTLKTRAGADALTSAYYRQTARDIGHYLEDPKANAPKTATPAWGQGAALTLPAAAGTATGLIPLGCGVGAISLRSASGRR